MGTHITMPSEVLQQLDLAQSPLREDLFAEDIGHFLDGDAIACELVRGSTIIRLD